MKLGLGVVVVAAAVVAASLLTADVAVAAKPCGRRDVGRGLKARVATVSVSCSTGWRVTNAFYERVLGPAGPGGERPPPYYLVEGFRCVAMLAGSQMSCRSGRRRVRASTRDDDFPARNIPRSRFRLGSTAAAGYMRAALSRRPALNFRMAYARRVRCNKRLSRTRLRCRMSWVVGDLSFSGRGMIWVTRSTYWNYAYRVARLNEYCVVTGGDGCTKRYVAR